MNDGLKTAKAILSAVRAILDFRNALTLGIVGAIFYGLSWTPDWLGVRSAAQAWRPLSLLVTALGFTRFVVDRGATRMKMSRKARFVRDQMEALQAERIHFLETMTVAERGICLGFIAPNHRARYLRQDSEVLTLVSRGVLRQISDVAQSDEMGVLCTDYEMVDWAWSYLHGHPDLLGDGNSRSNSSPRAP